MRMGLERAGWHVVWANDIDEDKMKMYRGHFADDDAHFHLGDVHTINPDDIPVVALATASFPCNDLSLAGARRGLAGQNSGAFWGFVNAIKGMGNHRPPLVMLENVPGFLTSHDGNDFSDACLALNQLGYAVDAFIIDAALFVPQSRRRLFLIGKREKRTVERVSETPTFYESQCRPLALADFILLHPEIWWSLRNLPTIAETKRGITEILEDLPENSACWWSKQRAEYLLNQMSEKHRAIADRMIAGENDVWNRFPPGSVWPIHGRVENGWHCWMPSHPKRRQWSPNPVCSRQGPVCCSPAYAKGVCPPYGCRRFPNHGPVKPSSLRVRRRCVRSRHSLDCR